MRKSKQHPPNKNQQPENIFFCLGSQTFQIWKNPKRKEKRKRKPKRKEPKEKNKEKDKDKRKPVYILYI